MPSTTCLLAALVPLATGCLHEELPQPDVAKLEVTMRWMGQGQRLLDFSIPDDLPCTGTESGFLGESGIECTGAPWALTLDGVDIETTPVTCTSAHDGWFGPVPKRCDGGRATAELPEGASVDVEVVATSEVDERRVTLREVRRTFPWIEVAPLQSESAPGIVRVDGIGVEGELLAAWFTPPGGGAPLRGFARAATDASGQLELRLVDAGPDGVYQVRVHAYARTEGVRIAVPLEGTLTVAR